MKIAANLSLLFGEMPLLERVRAARVAGFDGVEIQFPYAVPAIQLEEALQRAGLPLLLINLPAGDLMSGGAGLACVPQQQAAFDLALDEALTYAAMTRPRYVNVLAGRLVPGVTQAQAWMCLTDNLRRTAQAFNTLGIGVLCEAINPLDMPGFLLNTPAQMLDLLAAVDHPNLALQLDLYHMARQGLDLPQVITQLAGKIGHVQFADCPGRGEPGTGQLDFGVALRALADSDYQGWLGAEYRPSGADHLGWLEQWHHLRS
ncbi:hydroxypyruvate isomerase family protein [Pseudomonas sp. N040]|uniref:hydroxypyruvate isomerase family protein n=1 Tax=Pseudomonas sp. N040 TaxID=2785325 RepID=UPI0018A25B7B|nr:TIM barrel protein [Pseudomonas sp. N040]MBF7729315.1 TIM barrel protein [Pseudomonas sp. N040]MBW7012955.1 TIM barrel protein [Pseudomonas sp. N040]